MICLKNNMTYPLIFNGYYFPPHEVKVVDIEKTKEIKTAIRRGVLTEYLYKEPVEETVNEPAVTVQPKAVKRNTKKKVSE